MFCHRLGPCLLRADRVELLPRLLEVAVRLLLLAEVRVLDLAQLHGLRVVAFLELGVVGPEVADEIPRLLRAELLTVALPWRLLARIACRLVRLVAGSVGIGLLDLVFGVVCHDGFLSARPAGIRKSHHELHSGLGIMIRKGERPGTFHQTKRFKGWKAPAF